MQENDLLQKLMLQQRSSVRRSSLKDKPEADVSVPEEEPIASRPKEEVVEPPPVTIAQQPEAAEPVAEKAPLTEAEIFPVGQPLQDVVEEKPALTERDLFPENTLELPTPRKRKAVKVILPKEPVAERSAEPEVPRTRDVVVDEAVVKSSAEEVTDTLPEERTYAEEVFPIEEPRRKKPSNANTRTYAVLLAGALLAGFGGYYFYLTQHNTNRRIAKTTTQPTVAVSQPTALSTDSAHGDLKKSVTLPTATAEPKTKPAETPAVKKPEAKAPTATPVVEKNKTATEPITTASTAVRYKVIMKAYFHDKPDESTRRKAFIIHWNNAVLTPQDEKNGFIYVVFTNHLGQTSKGWLRKKDLIQLK